MKQIAILLAILAVLLIAADYAAIEPQAIYLPVLSTGRGPLPLAPTPPPDCFPDDRRVIEWTCAEDGAVIVIATVMPPK